MFPVAWYHTVQRFAVSYSVIHKYKFWLLSIIMQTLFLKTFFKRILWRWLISVRKGFVTVGHHPFFTLDQTPIEGPCEANVVLHIILLLAGSDLTL